jgi:hypothetical protein
MTLFKRGNSTDERSWRRPPAPRPVRKARPSDDPQPTTTPQDQPPPPAAPLGWYPDPDSPTVLRFWNGAAWDAPDGAALYADHTGLGCTSMPEQMPEQLSSPIEAGRLGVTGSEGLAPLVRSSRIFLSAAALAAAVTVATLLDMQTAPSQCQESTAVLGDATSPVAGRLNECAWPEEPTRQFGADPEGPHGPYPPPIEKCFRHDPGV